MLPNEILDNFEFDETAGKAHAEEGEVVAKFFSPVEAEIAAARLRLAGIHCFLANTASQAVVPHLQTIVRLHVRPADSARAREILQEAAIDTLTLPGDATGKVVLTALAVLIGVVLAALLVRAVWYL